MNVKKSIAALAVGGAITMALAGCSGGGGGTASATNADLSKVDYKGSVSVITASKQRARGLSGPRW